MLSVLLTLVYVGVCLFLILVVLLQTGKRADLAGAFGGGGSQTALGTRGAATLLSKLTTVFAVLFMLLALTLAILSSRGVGTTGSVLEEVQTAPAESPAPAVPQPAGTTAPPADAAPAEAPAEQP